MDALLRHDANIEIQATPRQDFSWSQNTGRVQAVALARQFEKDRINILAAYCRD